ncbi:protein MOTHER of FT and TFL1-like isoform X1 [Macadamia integrifolia]|uniref:protein MOTHER of FT and TFL1-like isoform X1 n=1 Tax=Macadamia integrifolia TaxID=60698 RepID=UPI001C4F7DDB|nr:protein MOTHER of FT and TFL1-like isoform X1 [Macadamia integrifolia]
MAASVEPLVVGRVIGDVIDMFVPSVSMAVYYGPKHIANGCEIKPSMTINPPRILISGPCHELFTLVMTDPDAPSPSDPTMRELVHWIVVNIPGGTNPTHGFLAQLHDSWYISSCTKLEDTCHDKYDDTCGTSLCFHVDQFYATRGIHRFIFVLYKQKSEVNEVEQPEPRSNFSTRAFANNLDLGVPVATVYFNAQKEPASRRR